MSLNMLLQYAGDIHLYTTVRSGQFNNTQSTYDQSPSYIAVEHR